MRDTVPRLLSQGIGHLKSGGNVEAFMNSVDAASLSAAEHEELSSLLHLSASLFVLGEEPIPAPRAKAANRARFLTEAVRIKESQRSRTRQLFWFGLPLRLRQSIVGVLLVVVMIMTTTTGVRAAAGSLPGSPLYPVKLAVENAQIAVTRDPAALTQLHLTFATRRSTELLTLVSNNLPVDPSVIDGLAAHLAQARAKAESAGSSTRPSLLQKVIEVAGAKSEELERATAAQPQAGPELVAGAAAARAAKAEAELALARLPVGDPTPPPTATSTIRAPGLNPTQQNTRVLPVTTVQPGRTATAVSSPTAVPTATATATDQRTNGSTPVGAIGTSTPDRAEGPTATRTATIAPSQTAMPSATMMATATATPTVPEPATPTPTSTEVPSPTVPAEPPEEPTSVPQALFHLTKSDFPDPVPATYNVQYRICVVNDGDVPLTNVVLVDRWSGCAYLVPDNQREMTWNLGTVGPHEQRCVEFTLNTFSVCNGQTITNEAVMTCDQGTARTVETTRVGPQPPPPPTTVAPTSVPTATLTAGETMAAE